MHRTVVQARGSQTLLEAMDHVLRKFNLSSQVMTVCKVGQDRPIPWQTPADLLEQQELALKPALRYCTFVNQDANRRTDLPLPSLMEHILISLFYRSKLCGRFVANADDCHVVAHTCADTGGSLSKPRADVRIEPTPQRREW